MRFDARKLALLLAMAILALLVVGCGGGGSTTEGTQSSEAAAGSNASEASEPGLGTPQKATGASIVFGMLNLENGPIAFPQEREGAEAAIDYVNEYKDGIHGHPIKLVNCATDGQPSTSTRCANRIVEEDPLLILGAADTGASGAMPVYERKELAYLGGTPLTPAEAGYKYGAIFVSATVGDSTPAYAKEDLEAKSAVVVETSDTEGKAVGSIIQNSLEGAGLSVKVVSVAPTASDLAAPAAEAVADNPEFIYLVVPNNCGAIFKALQSVGNTAQLASVGGCASPAVLESAGSAGEGVLFSEPTESLEGESEEAKITNEAFDKYASEEMARESNAVVAFGSVMNIWEKLNAAPAAIVNEPSSVLEQFTKGTENSNWMAHPYTCDGKQVPTEIAVCNGFQKVVEAKGTKLISVTGWLEGARYYSP